MKVQNLEVWHAVVCGIENFQCRICRKDFDHEAYFQEDNGRRVNQYVTGHHIKTQKAFPELRLETENGCAVCKECHGKIHKGLAVVPDVYTTVSTVKQTRDKYTSAPLPISDEMDLMHKMCKCGKFIAMKVSRVCMACEKRGPSTFKKEEKKKK